MFNLIQFFALPYANSEEAARKQAIELEIEKMEEEGDKVVRDTLMLLPCKLMKFIQEEGITFEYNPIAPFSVNAEKARITLREDIELVGFPYQISKWENLLYSVAHEIGHILLYKEGLDHHDEELAWVEAYTLLLQLDLLHNEQMFDEFEAHCLSSYGIQV